ncbi:hypothetical protein SMICM304S_02181 [Streptomyces microflavus]
MTSPSFAYAELSRTGVPSARAFAAAGSSSFTYEVSRAASPMTILFSSVPNATMVELSSTQAGEFISRLCSSAEIRRASSLAPLPFRGQEWAFPVGLTMSKVPQPFSSS